MKSIFGAIALLVAAPVGAQTAPAGADPHAGHAQHQQGHAQHQQQGQAGHEQHKDCCKDGKHGQCCDKAKQQGQKMGCCAEHGEGEHKATAPNR